MTKDMVQKKAIVDAPGKNGNASMAEQVQRPNLWGKTMMTAMIYVSINKQLIRKLSNLLRMSVLPGVRLRANGVL